MDDDSCHNIDLIETDEQVVIDSLSRWSSDLSITSFNGTSIWKMSDINAMKSKFVF